MVKSIFIFILALLLLQTATAQRRDTSIYYFEKSGKITDTKDSANYFVVVMPPDTVVDKNLFIVKGFYMDGKTRFTGTSKNKTPRFKYQGTLIAYFPNGAKKRTMSYENGIVLGDVVEYYPNGKLYNIKTNSAEKSVLFKECRDSTGKVLAENGNGQWIKFDESFNRIEVRGAIKNGLGDGIWHIRVNDSLETINEYKNGNIVSIANSYKSGYKTYAMVETEPEFPGGTTVFGEFISHNVVYPIAARKNGTQGHVIVTFVIESDGTLTNVKVAKGIGYGCDEESVRVVKLSPPWKPGYQDGRPVRVVYTVPISFKLSN